MALLPVNMGQNLPTGRLAAALAALPPGAPVVVMIHGYRFCPDSDAHSPHRHILSDRPRPGCWKAVSWPRHLGLTGDRGLAIAYGWPARGSIWAALRRAQAAAADLARLIARIRALDPARPVHLVGHSLGARVGLLALRDLAPGDVQRAILIAAALFRRETRALLDASPAARTAQIINVTGRENLAFDLALRLAAPLAGPTLGRGLEAPNWLDLPLDRSGTLAALRDLGHRIAAPKAPICHWSGYLRPGVFGLYRALLHRPAETPLPVLRAALARPRPRALPDFPLPFRPRTPS